MADSVSVVVMTFDEAATLAATTREIHAELTRLERPFEVLIVDDGSRDGSGELADRLAAELPSVRVVHHDANLGLGGVYRTGFAQARCDLVSFFPADGQFPATILGHFVALIDEADFVLGTLPERHSLAALVLNLAERAAYRLLLGPLPRFQGVLMFRRALLERFPLRSQGRGWAVLMELLLRSTRAGCRMRNVATPLRPRSSGHSKVRNLATILSNLRQLVALRRTLS